MCEALGNPPFGRDLPPSWLPKWEEGVKATGVAVVRGQVKLSAAVRQPLGGRQQYNWNHIRHSCCPPHTLIADALANRIAGTIRLPSKQEGKCESVRESGEGWLWWFWPE